MRSFLTRPASCLKGTISLLGDKSIAHRCIILGAISHGKTVVKNFPFNRDSLSTINAFRKLGIKISEDRRHSLAIVYGKGLSGLSKPKNHIFVAESGTTLRLMLGILAAQDFTVKLTAAESLSLRPMLRLSFPLRRMGAAIEAKVKYQGSVREEYPPLTVKGSRLKAITYKMPIASAQVKSAILLAGLYAQGATTIIEPIKTRDHTERLLKAFGADIKLKANKVVIKGGRELVTPKEIYIPGDISSASFFIVLATILPKSGIRIRRVSLNPSRLGIIQVLRRMGAAIDIKISSKMGEPFGDLQVKSSPLKGAIITEKEIPSLIDELPILMVAACWAKGKTVFRGAGELRVKETDRIRSMSENLNRMGADIKIRKAVASEDIIIRGVKELQGRQIRSFRDHRTAMSMIVAGLGAKGLSRIDDISCINKSFPGFCALLATLIK